MGISKDDFFEKLLATFRLEADEHVKNLTNGLLKLEKASTPEQQAQSIEIAFREVHSLKGAARAVNISLIESTCQAMENVFAAMKNQRIQLSRELFDTLHNIVDRLNQFLLSALDHEPTASEQSHIIEGARILDRVLGGIVPAQEQLPVVEAKPHELSEKSFLTGTVRIPTTKLDSLLYQAEELLVTKLTTGQRSSELKELNTALAEWSKQWNKISQDVRIINRQSKGNNHTNPDTLKKTNGELARLLEFLEWNHAFIQSLQNKTLAISAFLQQDHRTVSKMVDELLEDVKSVLMLPFSSLLEMFPKLVRDLSRDRGKEVQLIITGAEIEIDKRILEEIKDPLIHIVRNCVDHGIEKPEGRERSRKAPQGTIQIIVARKDGRTIEVSVSDDGEGIDLAKVLEAAKKNGMISREDAAKLTEQETLALIFQSGISTSAFVTDISGRGLGLAIVREKVEKLGGAVTVEATSGFGTSFRLALPLTLATFQGTLVRVNDQLYALPTMSVERVVRVKNNDIKTVENRETILLNGQAVALVRLCDVLELPRKNTINNSVENVRAVVLSSADKHIAFAVDEILFEQEVLVKNLGRQLSRVRNIAGATMLGNGKVVSILNVSDLMKSAIKTSVSLRAAAQEEKLEAKQKSILVVEDSITSRTLLKNILESAGYIVRTAVDGLDALASLKTEDVDLVVSDVDMPRMNGFDLTSKIRGDKKLEEKPVVLVTALESREDRERGIDVGANAYIVKSSFDQSNLLEVIHRLV